MKAMNDEVIDPEFRKAGLAELRTRFDEEFVTNFARRHGTPLMIFDPEKVAEQYEALQWYMPRIKHYYAMKPLPLPEIARVVKEHDGYMDVASKKEIEMAFKEGFTAQQLIHTNPHKKIDDIRHGIDHGVTTYVFDSPGEVDKLAQFKNHLKAFLRLSFPNKAAQVDLSYKFGVAPDKALDLLKYALDKGLDVSGVSYHGGSQLDDTEAYAASLKKTRKFMDDAREKFGHNFRTLDIGGGLPATYIKPVHAIEKFAEVINPILDEHFPTMEIISEPGRFVVNSSVTLVTQVVGKSVRDNRSWYFIDDGLYGSFSGILFDFSSYILYGAKELTNDLPIEDFVVGGPTCDSHDVVREQAPLPKLENGDLIVVPNMGAYSWTHSTEFNSLERPKIYLRDGTRIA